jgi:hypothetical protein
MPILDIDKLKLDIRILSWFSECTPKILVVTDALSYSSSDVFGLTEFVETLRATMIHGMTPIVITAQFDPDPMAALSYNAADKHISNYKFTDATHGLLKSRYDVVFILSFNRESEEKLTDEPGALDAVVNFMQAGGGLFSTGDHEDLGAGMCMDIPRVRNMRYWTITTTPSATGTDRLTTNLPGRSDIAGSNDKYEFSDQSDQFPQRLYVNFRTDAGGIGTAHPLLQVPGSVPNRAIEVFPDHPHEGECIIPSNLTTKLPDGSTDEWPTEPGSTTRVVPEMVAITVSHGNAFPGKAAVQPRSFIAICAYDGQRADVGRVVTDATWHHFVNVNIKPGMASLGGRDLADIKQYYGNLANWLMPKNLRFCLRYPWILKELMQFPLFEEVPPMPSIKHDAPTLLKIGALVEHSLLQHHTRSTVNSLIDDALEEALGPDTKRKLEEFERNLGKFSAHDAGLTAIGSLTIATAKLFNSYKEESDINGDETFARIGREASTHGVKLYLAEARKQFQLVADFIESVR